MIPREILASVHRAALAPRRVEKEFNGLVSSGVKIRVAGTARQDLSQLYAAGLRPKHKIELFDTVFYLTNARQIPELRFYVCYVVQPTFKSGKLEER